MPRQLPRLSVLLQPSQAYDASSPSAASSTSQQRPSVYSSPSTTRLPRRTREELDQDEETEDEEERRPSVARRHVGTEHPHSHSHADGNGNTNDSSFRRSPRLNRGLLPQPVVFRQTLEHGQEERDKRPSNGFETPRDEHETSQTINKAQTSATKAPPTTTTSSSPTNSPSLGINSNKTQIQPIYPRERTSRYLSEGDRRTILSRIEKGEKQSVLAKEYRVSRAAICNLYKNRQEVLFRADRDPDAKHPKRARTSKHKTIIKDEQLAHPPQQQQESVPTTAPEVSTIAPSATSVAKLVPTTSETTPSSSSTSSSISPMGESTYSNPFVRRSDHQSSLSTRDGQYEEEHHQPVQHPRVDQRQRLDERQQQMEQRHRTEMHSHIRRNGYIYDTEDRELHVHQVGVKCDSIKILQAVLRDESTQVEEYRLATDRILRLLFEEAILFLPKRRKEFRTSLGDECEGVTFYRKDRVCAVSMERCGNVMLQALSQVEPMIPTGHVSLACYQSSVAGGNLTPPSMENRNQVHFHLPPTLTNSCKLYLLDTVCSTGSEACIVIHALINQLQFREGNIYFVTLLSAYPALRRIHQLFPEVVLITGWMDGKVDQLNRIRPGIGNFYKRYWNLSTSPSAGGSS